MINKFYFDDNRKILDFLNKKEVKVDLVYFDPPFGINVDKSFNFYLKDSEYSNFLEEVLKKTYDVMSNRASIYVHCDKSNNYILRLILNKIFGKSNFINEIIWNKGFRGTESKNKWQQSHDTILFYAKSKSYVWNQPNQEYKSTGRYNKIDENGNKFALIKRIRTDNTVYYGKSYFKGKKSMMILLIFHY